jgi:hypothetical protein
VEQRDTGVVPDYLDFSTKERRKAMCEAEVRINRRTAPALYRGVVAVTREKDGSLALGGSGDPVEWLVEMVRSAPSQYRPARRVPDAARDDTGPDSAGNPAHVVCYPAGSDEFSAATSNIALRLRRLASASFVRLETMSPPRSPCHAARAFRHRRRSMLPLRERGSATASPSS